MIATGVQTSVRDFIDRTAKRLGLHLSWSGEGVDESGTVADVEFHATKNKQEEEVLKALVGKTIVCVDPKYFRPTEVDTLLGDPTKAKEKLGWTPKITLDEMIDEMVSSDLDQARRLAVLRDSGFDVALASE